MKLARVKTSSGWSYVAFKDGSWHEVDDIFASTLTYTGRELGADPTFLTPTMPRVILGMAHNGTKDEIKRPPQAFQKSSHTATAHLSPIFKDPELGRMDVECELVTVIKKRARKLTLSNAEEHILGFTIGNDVTMPEQTPQDNLLLQTKNGDGFTPLGPWIETDLIHPDNRDIYVSVNGRRVVRTSTNQLARGVLDQLVYITSYMTLNPGDVVLGGSPTSMYPVEVGDVVELEIEGLGILQNPIESLP